MKHEMIELTENEMYVIHGGAVSNDATYGAAIAVSVFALGALITIATAGVAAPAVVAIGLGVVGTAANASAIAVAIS